MELPNRVTFRRVRDHLPLDDPEEDNDILRRFAGAVILSAMHDAAGRSKRITSKQMAEAKAWLLDEENELWFELAGVQRKHILPWFEGGCKITREHRLGSRKQHYGKKIYYEYELKTEPLVKKAPIDPDLGPEY